MSCNMPISCVSCLGWDVQMAAISLLLHSGIYRAASTDAPRDAVCLSLTPQDPKAPHDALLTDGGGGGFCHMSIACLEFFSAKARLPCIGYVTCSCSTLIPPSTYTYHPPKPSLTHRSALCFVFITPSHGHIFILFSRHDPSKHSHRAVTRAQADGTATVGPPPKVVRAFMCRAVR